MITWATTVDPQTVSSENLSENFTFTRVGSPKSDKWESTYGTTLWNNWSITVASTTDIEQLNGAAIVSSSSSCASVLGTANSQTGNSRTIRSVLNVTSTQTTRNYTYRKTGTQQSSYTYPCTTIVDSYTVTTATAVSATTVTTTAIGTAQESCLSTTTVANETVCTPILATVVVADKNEVIWAVNSSAATNMGGLSAATAVGTSTTRTTIMPWTKTVVAGNGNANQTTALSLPVISQVVPYASLQYTQTQSTTVTNYNELPHKPETVVVGTYQSQATQRNHTIIEAQTITATASKITNTIFATSYATLSETRHQIYFDTLTTATVTLTREASSTFAATSTASSTSLVTATSGSNGEAYSFTAATMRTQSAELTTFQPIPQAATIMFPNNGAAARSIDFYEGFYNKGDVAGGYSCRPLGLVYDSIFKEVSRGVSTIMPTVVRYYEENSEAGTMTVSGLSLTIQPKSATGSNSTATESFELEPFGSGKLQHMAAEPKSAINGASVGASESVYQALVAGVYSVGTSTFSTSGGFQSWSSGGDSQAAVIALSYFAPTTARNGASPVWWMVSRNSHSSATALTRSSAYNAP